MYIFKKWADQFFFLKKEYEKKQNKEKQRHEEEIYVHFRGMRGRSHFLLFPHNNSRNEDNKQKNKNITTN